MSSISIVIGGERKNGTMLVIIGVVIGVGESGNACVNRNVSSYVMACDNMCECVMM